MKILIIGGYGNFGKRLVHSLLAYYEHQIIIAGRSDKKLQEFTESLFVSYKKTISAVKLDVLNDDITSLLVNLNPDIVVNAAGPYQLQRSDDKNNNIYPLASACIKVKSHYIDLADNREFVTSFSKVLNDDAKAAGVMLVSGASTVPGLSIAVIEEFIKEFSQLDSIRYGITPGNKTERGVATVASILSYTGRPIKTKIDGAWFKVFGWQGLERYDFGVSIGKRWMSYCEIPDLDLIPIRFPAIKSIQFKAGLELSILHLGLWFLSGLVRLGLIKNLVGFSGMLKRMSEWFFPWGSDDGGMYVELRGTGKDLKERKISWQLVALNGSGPNVPTISAEIIIQKISRGEVTIGAMPCVGFFNLQDFFTIAERWGIYQTKEVL